jgi:hypothetical protein
MTPIDYLIKRESVDLLLRYMHEILGNEFVSKSPQFWECVRLC